MAFIRIVKKRKSNTEAIAEAEQTVRKKRNGQGSILPFATWILIAVVFLAAIVVDAFFSNSGIRRIWELKADHENLLEEINQIEADNERLRLRINAIKSEPTAVEEIARESLNLVKPGEDVYIFSEEPKVPVLDSGEQD